MSRLIVKKYSYEFIFEFKDATKESDKLNHILNKINDSFMTSTDYQQNKYKKDNYIPLKIKKKDKIKLNKDDIFKKKINGILNKLSGVNLKKMSEKIMKSNIENYNMLNYLTKSLFNKILDEPSYIDKYIKIVELISTRNKKWTFEKDEKKYNFKILILNLSQQKFELLLKEEYLINLDNKDIKEDEADKYYLEKKRITSCILLISYMYVNKLLASEVFKSCLGYLLSYNNDLCYELSYKMMNVSYKYMKKNDKTYFNLCMKILKDLLKKKEISSRIKYGIQDFIDNNKIKRKTKNTKEKNNIKEKNNKKEKNNIKEKTNWKGLYVNKDRLYVNKDRLYVNKNRLYVNKNNKKELNNSEDESINKEKMISQVGNLVREYLSHKNYQETKLYLKDMDMKDNLYLLVNGIIEFIYDARDKQIKEAISLLILLLKNKNISLKVLKLGIEESLLEFNDLIIDMPIIKDYWLNIFNELIKNKYISLNYITRITNKNLDKKSYTYIKENINKKN
mgnify:CR=1 FL=1|jgi:hypothetical protein